MSEKKGENNAAITRIGCLQLFNQLAPELDAWARQNSRRLPEPMPPALEQRIHALASAQPSHRQYQTGDTAGPFDRIVGFIPLVGKNRVETLQYIDQALALLADNGKAVLVAPIAVLDHFGRDRDFSHQTAWLEHGLLQTVVTGNREHWRGVPQSFAILVFDKSLKSDHVQMVNLDDFFASDGDLVPFVVRNNLHDALLKALRDPFKRKAATALAPCVRHVPVQEILQTGHLDPRAYLRAGEENDFWCQLINGQGALTELASLATVFAGRRMAGAELVTAAVGTTPCAYLQLRDIDEDGQCHAARWINRELKPREAESLLQPGDVLVSRKSWKMVVYVGDSARVLPADNIIVVRPDLSRLNADYAMVCLTNQPCAHEIIHCIALDRTLSLEIVRRVMVPLLPLDLQKKLVSSLSEASEKDLVRVIAKVTGGKIKGEDYL